MRFPRRCRLRPTLGVMSCSLLVRQCRSPIAQLVESDNRDSRRLRAPAGPRGSVTLADVPRAALPAPVSAHRAGTWTFRGWLLLRNAYRHVVADEVQNLRTMATPLLPPTHSGSILVAERDCQGSAKPTCGYRMRADQAASVRGIGVYRGSGPWPAVSVSWRARH
jgi:hypothetical protein